MSISEIAVTIIIWEVVRKIAVNIYYKIINK